ncbi:MAG TPA: hypothetical protein VLE91_02545 [Candidatus Saccharimonadales bacterium]|nr:hypothetical protein [Candidatus Saccharimonadales bacterium]
MSNIETLQFHPDQVQLEIPFDDLRQVVIDRGFELRYDGENILGGRSIIATHKALNRFFFAVSVPNLKGEETTWTIRTVLPDLLNMEGAV